MKSNDTLANEIAWSVIERLHGWLNVDKAKTDAVMEDLTITIRRFLEANRPEGSSP